MAASAPGLPITAYRRPLRADIHVQGDRYSKTTYVFQSGSAKVTVDYLSYTNKDCVRVPAIETLNEYWAPKTVVLHKTLSFVKGELHSANQEVLPQCSQTAY